ncbi:MAG: UDP-N-acetylmuramoyl-tripeptide--D-alanyl-D-alanine ligase [Urechidicola sp.]|jgi:UDP-N-acetylmuramoyl-tripeptide--D-alanyl-D-alanine ligase
MISLSLQQLADIFNLDIFATREEQPALQFKGVTIDSRNDCSGQLFVAIKGECFDGHDYVTSAFKNGAVVALVESQLDCDIPQIIVPDCKQAMAKLANFWRHDCNAAVIALTGSNGKTTVKEMLHQILQKEASTHSTRGNFNNDIGVPLTLFDLSKKNQYTIIEMGANHVGEIANLATIAEPDIVYVNNAAAAHLAGFGSLQGVVDAKGELYAYCQPQHRALFNTDEVASQQWQTTCAADHTMSCGLNATANVQGQWEATDEGLLLTVKYKGQICQVYIHVFGEHNARNALAAISIALIAGIEFKSAVINLTDFEPVKGRLQMLQGPNNSRLIDDSYNANPGSLEAGVKVLCSLKGEPWLALGDMGELGSDAELLHIKVAEVAKKQGVKKLFGIGPMSCVASAIFGDAGYCFDKVEDSALMVRSLIHQDVNLLIKGSRSAGMDQLVKALIASDTVLEERSPSKINPDKCKADQDKQETKNAL